MLVTATRSIHKSMQQGGANCAFTKGRAAVEAVKAFSAVNDVRHNPIYNLNCNPPNPIIKSHFHACRVCPVGGMSGPGQYGRNVSLL